MQVVIAGVNPGEIAIREGTMEALFPATFPSGQGRDFAGRVVSACPDLRGIVARSPAAQCDDGGGVLGRISDGGLVWFRRGGAVDAPACRSGRQSAPPP